MTEFANSTLVLTQAECEREIARVWAELLQYDGDISASANFFELGGDSLAQMMMLFRLGESYRVEITPSEFIEQPTLGALVKRVYVEALRQTDRGR